MSEEITLEFVKQESVDVIYRDAAGLCRRAMAISARQRHWTLAWYFIGLVSVWDAYLVHVYQEVILQVEANPIAWYIIDYSGSDVGLFLVFKAAGTCMVLTILSALRAAAPRYAYPVIHSVAAFQFGLLLFLHLS